MNKKLIEQLRNGEVILDNTEAINPSKIKEIVRLAWNSVAANGTAKYFYIPEKYMGYGDYKSVWSSSGAIPYNNSRPLVAASEFLKEDEEEFVWGEEINICLGTDWVNGKYVGKNPCDDRFHIIMLKEGFGGPQNRLKSAIRKIKPVKEVTLAEVAEKFGVPQIKIIQ